MAVSSISIPRYPIGVSQLLSTSRVARLSVRGEMSSSQSDHQPGDIALGPEVTLFDGLGSTLATQQSYERLFSRVRLQNRRQPANSTGRYEAALKSLSRIEQSSHRLELALEEMMANGGLNTNQALSNVPGVQVQADPEAETGEVSFYPYTTCPGSENRFGGTIRPSRFSRLGGNPPH